LSDDSRRQIYDATGMDSNEQQQAGGPFSGGGFGFNPFGEAFWGSFAKRGEGSGTRGAQAGGFEDLLNEFEQFFAMNEGAQKAGRAEAGRIKGKDVNVALEIDFMEAINGT
jgi:DnaJ-class molecular chaperone